MAKARVMTEEEWHSICAKDGETGQHLAYCDVITMLITIKEALQVKAKPMSDLADSDEGFGDISNQEIEEYNVLEAKIGLLEDLIDGVKERRDKECPHFTIRCSSDL